LKVDKDYTNKALQLRNLWSRNASCAGLDQNLEYAYSLELNPFFTNPQPDGERYFYHSDHLGSSAYITTENGYATQFLAYMPYGETLSEQQNSTSYYSPFKFSAKEKDTETGYSYFGARYYSPELSVWLGIDPLSDKFANWNTYAYCFASPVRFRDFWGLEGVDQETANSGKAKNGDTYTDKSGNTFVNQGGMWVSQALVAENTEIGSENAVNIGKKDWLELILGASGSYNDIKGNILHNHLYWKGKTTGKIYTKNPFSKNKVGWKANSFKATGKQFQAAKSLGTKLGVVGLAFTAGDILVGDGLTTSNILDATFGAAGFIPGVGWMISGSYFLVNTGVQLYSGKSIGDHLDE
jgi:RHS repeat-associated protein